MNDLSLAPTEKVVPDADGGAKTKPPGLDTGVAQLAAWCLLAVVNQLLISVLLPAAPFRVRALHRAYDAGHFIALGVISLAAVRAAASARASMAPRFPRVAGWLNLVLLFSAVLAVALSSVGDDVANFARRYEVAPPLVTLGASLLLAVMLGSSSFLVRSWPAWFRALLAGAGLCVAVANALVLEGDYPAVHFMLGWASALLLGAAIQGLALPRLRRQARGVALAAMAVAGAAALAISPRNEVAHQLFSLPSSIAVPFVARLNSRQAGSSLARVPESVRASSWFNDRRSLPPVPPSRAFDLPENPIVIFLTIDAMRADVLEKRKYQKLMPELHKLRKRSFYFGLARAPTASTTTTMASVFASKYYSQLRWSGPGDGLVQVLDPTPRFPELLSKAGVHTVHAAKLARLLAGNGVALGFTSEYWIGEGEGRADRAVDQLIEELEVSSDGPLFLYTHFMEPHAPYNLGKRSGSLFDRYVSEVAVVDKHIGKLRRAISDKGLEDRTVLIVSADHGEAFGEHGTTLHATTAYEELLRVPLLVHVPGVRGRMIDEPVTVMDVGPTVLDLFGLPTPGAYMGQSLLPLMAGRRETLDRPIAADTGRHHQVLYFRDGKKVIMNQKRGFVEVYDLNEDPGELVNLADSGDSEVEIAIETTKLFFQAHRRAKTAEP